MTEMDQMEPERNDSLLAELTDQELAAEELDSVAGGLGTTPPAPTPVPIPYPNTGFTHAGP